MESTKWIIFVHQRSCYMRGALLKALMPSACDIRPVIINRWSCMRMESKLQN